MTEKAKQEIFTRLTLPIDKHGISKLGARKVDRTTEAIAKKYGLTIDEVIDENDRQLHLLRSASDERKAGA